MAPSRALLAPLGAVKIMDAKSLCSLARVGKHTAGCCFTPSLHQGNEVAVLLCETAQWFPSRRLTTLLHHLVGFGFNFLVFGKVSSGSFEVFFLHWRTLLFHRGWLRNRYIAHTSASHA